VYGAVNILQNSEWGKVLLGILAKRNPFKVIILNNINPDEMRKSNLNVKVSLP